jgi:FMN phosphatase YigB (HAD superfamily)
MVVIQHPMVKPEVNRLIVILDGDNTLWDTNRCFEVAKRAFLRQLARRGFRVQGRSPSQTLRQLDALLIERYGAKEYDFRRLAEAAIAVARGESIASAAQAQPDKAMTVAEQEACAEAQAALESGLQSIPRLTPGSRELLHFLRELRKQHTAAVYLVSEGRQSRLQRILQWHSLSVPEWFDGMSITSDKTAAMKQAADEGRQRLHCRNPLLVVVGDSLNWDIAPGNRLGAITVYKPGGFLGPEHPSSEDERPTYQVDDGFGVVHVLREILGSLHRHEVLHT